MTTQDPSVRLVTEESLSSGPGKAILDGGYVPVFGVQPTGTAAGDTAAISAAINNVIAQGSGIVYLNCGVYTPDGALPQFDPRYISIQGAGRNITIVRPTSGLTGDLFRAAGAVFGVDQATYFGDMTIDGVNAGNGACGLHWGDVNGGKLDRLDIRNFADSSPLTTPVGTDPTALSKGLWIDNTRATLGITERLELGDVRLYQNSVNILGTVQPGMASANSSFDYHRWKHVQISVAAGQVGIWLKNCIMQGDEINVMANMGSNSSNNSWLLYLDGSGADRAVQLLDGHFVVHSEADGTAGTVFGIFADSGTKISGSGLFSAYVAGGGATHTNSSAGTVALNGNMQIPGIYRSGAGSPFNMIATPAAPYTASPYDWVPVTTADAVTLPANPQPGQMVAIVREGTVTVTINANTGQLINGLSQVKMPASTLVTKSAALFVAESATTWTMFGGAGTDAGLGLFLSGALNIQGGVSMTVRTLTTAATISNADSMLYCTTGGVTHAFGTQTRTGQAQIIINKAGSAVTISAPAGATINGGSSLSIPAQSMAIIGVPVGGASADIWALISGSGSGAASTADPLGWGICTNVGPVVAGLAARTLVANQANFYRLVGGGVAITKGAVHVGTSSGNIGIAYYSNTGSGLSAAPGTLLASSGSVACPAAGYAPIALGATITPNAGDWVCVWSDNATATLLGPSANGFISTLFSGRAYRQSSVSGGPPATVGTLNAGQSLVVETVGVP